MAKAKHDWTKLDPLIDHLKAQGWNDTQIAKDLGIGRQTLVDHLRSREYGTPTAHQGIPEHSGVPPEHQGTLEEYQEVIEEVHQSVPDAPHLSADEVPLSTPIVHQEVSPDDSSTVHSGVPARPEPLMSTPMVHPGTPTAEDWDLWSTIKARWLEVEKMLADRQALLSTPLGTPGHIQKKTYVFDVRHIGLIDRYAQDHRLDLKEVIYSMCQEFFERRGYVATA
jgi:hypothetical protein